MKTLFAMVLMFGLSTNAAFATGDVFCRAVDGSDATFAYSFGRVPGLVILSASIAAKG